MKRWAFVPLLGLLAGCGSVTLPAAVRLADGTPLVGTTTAAISGGHFEVASPDKKIACSGTYDALDQSPTISVPVSCTNGLFGNAVVTRSPDGMRGTGYANVSDGTIAQVAFGNGAGSILIAPTISAPVATTTSPVYVSTQASTSVSSVRSSSRRYYRGPRGGCYYLTASGNKQYVDRSLCR